MNYTGHEYDFDPSLDKLLSLNRVGEQLLQESRVFMDNVVAKERILQKFTEVVEKNQNRILELKKQLKEKARANQTDIRKVI